jgi:small multidrug resistance pump
MIEFIKTILISLTVVTLYIFGDCYVKKASELEKYTGWRLLLIGTTIYFVSGFGLFWIYRSFKFVTVGAIQSIGVIVLSAFASHVIFEEKINGWEITGLLLSVVSLVILLCNGKI